MCGVISFSYKHIERCTHNVQRCSFDIKRSLKNSRIDGFILLMYNYLDLVSRCIKYLAREEKNVINTAIINGCGGTGDKCGSGPCIRKDVEVQVLSAAELTYNPNPNDIRLIGEGFGFVLSLKNLLT